MSVVKLLKKMVKTDPTFAHLLLAYSKQLLPSLNYFMILRGRQRSVNPQSFKLQSSGQASVISDLKSEISEFLDQLESACGKVASSITAGSFSGHQVHGADLRERIQRLEEISAVLRIS